jgi:ATP-binding cassette, subfamily B, bacterial MsbA
MLSKKYPTLLRNLLKTSSFWQSNRLLLSEVQHFPVIALLAVSFPMLSAVLEGFGIGFLLAFLQNLVTPNSPPIQTGVAWFDVWILGVNSSDTEQLYRVSGLILLSTWMRAVSNYLGVVYLEKAQLHLIDRLRQRIFEQLQALSLKFFSKSNTGEVINTLTTEIAQLKIAFNQFGFILSKSLVLLVYTLIALKISLHLSLLSVFLFGSVAIGLSKFTSVVREHSFPVSEANGRLVAIAIELISGIRTVQAFATEDFERRRFYRSSADIVKTGMTAALYSALIRPLAEGLASTVLIGMIIVGITVFVANGTLQVASLLTFLFILFRLVPAINEINGSLAIISVYQGSMSNIEALLRTTGKPYLLSGTKPFLEINQAIELQSVDFSYDGQTQVLQGINLEIKKGQTVALVGASGAGKTTLADLIPRFYDPTHGSIQVDGINLREYEIHSLRRKMAVVSQDTFIFNTSVRNNIAYGLEDVDDDLVKQAADSANALEFIELMPDGFETQLGDRGVRLSGGQRQRLAIARALLRNPDILILDEATSALDSVSERLIQASLEQLSSGRTVIAIAHRLSTIMRADKVVVLEQGRIIEEGTYQELLALRGKLWNYHQMQQQTELSELT